MKTLTNLAGFGVFLLIVWIAIWATIAESQLPIDGSTITPITPITRLIDRLP